MNWLNKNKHWISVLVIVAVLSLFFYSMGSMTVDDIINFTPASIPLAVFVFLSLYGLKSFTLFFPIAALYVSAGIIFPTVLALIVTYIGIAVKISVGYIIGMRLGENKTREILARHEKAANFLYGKGDNMTSSCFIARVLPLPVNMCDIFYGAVKMPYAKFLFISLVGMSPTMLPSLFAGASIANPFSLEFLLPFGISILIALTVFFIYRKLGKKRPLDVSNESLDKAYYNKKD